MDPTPNPAINSQLQLAPEPRVDPTHTPSPNTTIDPNKNPTQASSDAPTLTPAKHPENTTLPRVKSPSYSKTPTKAQYLTIHNDNFAKKLANKLRSSNSATDRMYTKHTRRTHGDPARHNHFT